MNKNILWYMYCFHSRWLPGFVCLTTAARLVTGAGPKCSLFSEQVWQLFRSAFIFAVQNLVLVKNINFPYDTI
jgi:hypothetical protein